MSDSAPGRHHVSPILRVPPPIWAVVLFALAAGLDVFLRPGSDAGFSSHPLGVVVFLTGLAWGLSCVRLFAVKKTAIAPASETNTVLITNGPYRISRNPMYSGLIILSLGVAIYIGTWPFYAVPVLLFFLYNGIFIPFEEEKMARQFGPAFDAYRARVRRWI